MAKSEFLWQPQSLHNASVGFNSSDDYAVWNVAPTSNGTNLTAGTRTFTAAGGTVIASGAGATTWTMPAKSDGSNVGVAGTPAITQMGQYKTGAGPTASANAAAVDSGSSNATFALTVGIVKLLYTAGAEGAIVTAINAVSTDSVARVVTILRQESGSTEVNPICATSVPASSGTSGALPTIDLLSSSLVPGAARDANNKPVLKLAPGAKLYATVPAVTASTFMRVNLTAEDLTAA